MIQVKKEGVLLKKSLLEFENEAVSNPAVMQEGDTVHVFYRAVQEGNYSTIGYCKLDGPLTIRERSDKPLITSQYNYESHGVEDPRIVKIEHLYYLTYTAYDGINAQGALAVSKDLQHFEKRGIIAPPITYAEFVYLLESSDEVNRKYYRNYKFYNQQNDMGSDEKVLLWDKDIIFFPSRIGGKLCFLNRIRPGIQLVAIHELKELTKTYWKKYCRNLKEHIVMDPVHKHESKYIGGGCPPIETEQGWLLIYHGVEETDNGLTYSAGAALLNLKDPREEISRLPYPLFSPENEWEQNGVVNNVVFPTGTALFGDTLYIYYGAADSQIACASVNIKDLVAELLKHRTKNEN